MTARDGHMVVTLRGELDVCTAPDAMPALAAHAATGAAVIIDLAELAYLDCSSLRQLLSVRAQARQAGGDLTLASPQPIVLRVLTLTEMISQCPVFAIVPDADDGATPF